jgi:hypothetical protein
MRSLLLVAIFSSLSVGATASEPTERGNFGNYTTIGTQGVGVGIAIPITPMINGRIEANKLDLSKDFSSGNVNYGTKIKNNSVAALIDYHMFSAMPSFRLTAGAFINDGGISGTGTTTSYNFNGASYTVGAGESATINAKFKTVAPYIGVGFGSMTKGFSFFNDIGAFYAKPSVGLTLTPGLAAAVNPADLAAETAALQNDLNRIKWYPVIRIGISYVF